MPEDGTRREAGLKLKRYDAMCAAIVACHRVDEVKEIRDQALALQVYAQQAQNLDAERKAAEVRLRAERRAGQLLEEMAKTGERDQSGGDRKSWSQPATMKLADLGISKSQSSRWQRLAQVSDQDFETALTDPASVPSTAALLRGGELPQMDSEALWLWGRLREFEERGLFDADPAYLHEQMTEAMREDMRRRLPVVLHFLGRYASEVLDAQASST